MKKKVIWLVPALCILVSGIFAYVMKERYTDRYVKVCVASHQLAQMTLIREEDLEEISVPKRMVNEDILSEKEDLIGKYVKLSCQIPKSSFFYKGALESEIPDLAGTLLMKDQVSYDIYVNEVRINTGSLQCGMYADVYLTVDDRQKPLSDVLIRNCRIIGIYDGSGKQILPYDRESRIQILSVALEKGDVTVFNTALHMGEITVLPSSDPYQTGTRSKLNLDCAVYPFPE